MHARRLSHGGDGCRFRGPRISRRATAGRENILPFLSGVEKQLPDRLLLFCDNVRLQNARFGRWKAHVARWRVPRYVPGYSDKDNIILEKPELYDVGIDPSESCDLAGDHPEVVGDLNHGLLTRCEPSLWKSGTQTMNC